VAELLEELLARCRHGDHEAVGVLVRRFWDYAMDLATHLLDDRHLAEDAVQDAFVVVVQRLEDLRSPTAFPGWLRRIVRTQAGRVSRQRRTGAAAGRDEPDAGSSPPHHAQEAELRRLVRDAVVSLPALSRATAELFYVYELDLNRVADVLGVPAGTVKRRLHDARRHLRDQLAGDLEGRDRSGMRRRRPEDELPI
jgi:RNA polymerase sigma factor (sigma-70 family)